MDGLTFGLCQMRVSDVKEENINKAEKMIEEAADRGADFIVLPEMFNCPYDNSYFREFAEDENGETVKALSQIAKKRNIYIAGGSIPEKDQEGNIYNTCFVFDKGGNIIAKHRKVHLFNIDMKDRIKFAESDVFKAGDKITLFDTPYGKMGAAICYDIRFPEFIRIMTLKGAKFIIVPAAFNMATGPAHFELLFRSRAVDNQIYMMGCAPARDTLTSYISYGNSMIVDPWGNVVSKLGYDENILVKKIDLDMIDEVRKSLPLLKNRREDLYSLKLND